MCELGPANDSTCSRDCYLRIANLAQVSLPNNRKNEVSEYCQSIPRIYIKACNDVLSGASLSESIDRNLLN